jgi:hypothetical protein
MPRAWGFVPIGTTIEPAAEFAAFVRERLARARDQRA